MDTHFLKKLKVFYRIIFNDPSSIYSINIIIMSYLGRTLYAKWQTCQIGGILSFDLEIEGQGQIENIRFSSNLVLYHMEQNL